MESMQIKQPEPMDSPQKRGPQKQIQLVDAPDQQQHKHTKTAQVGARIHKQKY
jgi:hypothetical protein